MRAAHARRRSAVGPAAWAAAALVAVLTGVVAATAPPSLVAGAVLALAVVLSVALHPPAGAYLIIGASPLLAGLSRGAVLPVLRPHEALAVLVAGGVLTHMGLSTAANSPPRLRLSVGPVDRAILLMALAGSVLPILVMLVRERTITQDDVLYGLVIWKYYVVFVLVRACAVTPSEVRTCLWIILWAAAFVALVAIMQVLHVPAVETAVTRLYIPEGINTLPDDRGSSTLASPIAVGDVMVFSLAAAGALMMTGQRRVTLLLALSGLLVLGIVATGQFSAIIAFVVGLLAFGFITKRIGRSVLAFTPVAGVAALLLWPVIERRISGFDGGSRLPASWESRRENVLTKFWPVLNADHNWLTGVRPLARVKGQPLSGIEFIWIESGYVFLLWSGGVVFVVAFLRYVWVASRVVGRVARSRHDAVGGAAVASFTALVITAVLMTLDPHLTLRGSADLSFALLALAIADPRTRHDAPANERSTAIGGPGGIRQPSRATSSPGAAKRKSAT